MTTGASMDPTVRTHHSLTTYTRTVLSVRVVFEEFMFET